ncbi:MAG TPA: M48 family metallopeptidase [Rhodocyclaceae bacterium]
MNQITGIYFDGRHPLGAEATLIWSGPEASLCATNGLARHPLKGLRISPRIGCADRFISFPGGGQLQCKDADLLDELPQEGKTEGIVAWLEARRGMALVGIAVIAVLAALAYFQGLPRLAEYAAARVPVSAEREVGETSLRWLDGHGFFKPSTVGCGSQYELRSDFRRLVRGLPLEQEYRLVFRDAPTLGANALALPGGIIVITDGMMKLTASPDEALAVLAHETGHVELRHALRHALQDSAVGAAIAAVTGDASSLTSVVAGLPVALAQANYSREFETEADTYAFELLRSRGVSPANFAEIMARLEKDHEGKAGAAGFLASHPPTPDRIARARAASVGLDSPQAAPGPVPWILWSSGSDCPDGAAP